MSTRARSLFTPADESFWRVARRVWSSREDLQNAYPDPESDAFAQWLAACASLEYPEEFAEFLPPVPPLWLVGSSSCGASQHTHLWSSTEDVQ